MQFSKGASILFLCSVTASCTTVDANTGFGLAELSQRPTCRVLTFRGEPVLRNVPRSDRKSMWGLGRCPGRHPDLDNTSIWVQRRIDVGPQVATMTTKVRPDGSYQRVTIRRNYNIKQPSYFRYTWVRHRP